MADWRDHGVVLSVRPFGEDGLVMRALTREHGLHAGLARWTSKRRRGGYVLQTGVEADLVWRARLEDQLGAWTLEPVKDHAALWLDDKRRLAGLSSAAALAETVLPERESHPGVAAGMEAFLASLEHEFWPAAYVRWEIGLLADLGFSLNLTSCAATGVTEDLIYVSPRTGRAVCAAAGEAYKDRMLPLPGFLRGEPALEDSDIAAGLTLTGHFLARDVLGAIHKDMPPARLRLADMYRESDIET